MQRGRHKAPTPVFLSITLGEIVLALLLLFPSRLAATRLLWQGYCFHTHVRGSFTPPKKNDTSTNPSLQVSKVFTRTSKYVLLISGR